MESSNYSFRSVSQDEYSQIIANCDDITFYNLKERMTFLASRKRKMELFVIEKENKPVGAGSWQKIPARSGTFIYFQHSPVCIDERIKKDPELWKELYKYAEGVGRKENVVYVRMTPRVVETPEIIEIVESAGFQKAPVQEVDASVTRIIDVQAFTLKSMTKSIHEELETAAKLDLSVDIKSDAAALQSFMMLYKKVIAKSDTFNLPLDYMKDELDTYLEAGKLIITLVHDTQGNVYSGSATVLGEKTAWYYWTVTTEKGETSGSHALMIHALVTYLKDEGYEMFDLWGEAVPKEVSEKRISHPWLKIDQFKSGFGSKLVEYVLPIDVPVNQAIYRASCLYQRFNMSRRGYPFLTFEHDQKIRKV